MVVAVVFDVGETLLDDTREYGAWADWLGVPRHTFSAVLGAVTAAGRNNAETFQYFRPGFDLATERQRREDAGLGETIEDTDLYPDVRPALTELRTRGLWVGIVGNQTAKVARLLRALNLPADAIATSGEWGAAKPDQAFFDRVAQFAPAARPDIVYVGDQRDKDILPARKAGMRTAHIRRGPAGHLWADDPTVLDAADWRINSLTELPALLRPST
ncbi:HAD family hydrolase [Pseudofrankia saprophytica]|uniref:HAD family hydrolase n=1 Tax=Pseudofrankia saprophytica TaxID=298655 RepID=UPI000234C725|nr:HAD family hydrolase [Pseudofrankia saprophytica]